MRERERGDCKGGGVSEKRGLLDNLLYIFIIEIFIFLRELKNLERLKIFFRL